MSPCICFCHVDYRRRKDASQIDPVQNSIAHFPLRSDLLSKCPAFYSRFQYHTPWDQAQDAVLRNPFLFFSDTIIQRFRLHRSDPQKVPPESSSTLKIQNSNTPPALQGISMRNLLFVFPVRDRKSMILCEYVHLPFLLISVARRHHRHCSDPGSHHFRQPVRSAHVRREVGSQTVPPHPHRPPQGLKFIPAHMAQWSTAIPRAPTKIRASSRRKASFVHFRKSVLRHRLIRRMASAAASAERVPPGDPQRLDRVPPATGSVLGLLRSYHDVPGQDLVAKAFRSSGKGCH